MKKLITILMGVIILFLSSVIYRERITPLTTHFPVKHFGEDPNEEVQLNIILFFSVNNCPPCLKVIDFLNKLSDKIRVVGIIPEKEMPILNEIRKTTGAVFPIYSFKRWKRYRPIYAPTLFGVGPDGIIYFMLPCVGLEEFYLSMYLDEFMRKAQFLLRAPKT